MFCYLQGFCILFWIVGGVHVVCVVTALSGFRDLLLSPRHNM